MPGLPGDTHGSIVETARKIAELSPDFARIYPALVIKGTALHEMYLKDSYRAWGMDEMAAVLKKIVEILSSRSIKVARIGLNPSKTLLASIVSGPWHPSLGSLVTRP
jgi:histone acetyltransferase (RNA polymerase elongator complex component)